MIIQNISPSIPLSIPQDSDNQVDRNHHHNQHPCRKNNNYTNYNTFHDNHTNQDDQPSLPSNSSSSDTDSNIYLSCHQSSIRSLLTRKCELCAKAANKFFTNQSKFQKRHVIATVVAIFLSFVSGVFGFAHGVWGEMLGANAKNTIIFVSAVMSLLASTMYAIIHAYGWEAKARESQLAAVMYSKTRTDIILALSAEHLSDAILTSITKDLEYIAQMTPNIYEKFILDSSCADCHTVDGNKSTLKRKRNGDTKEKKLFNTEHIHKHSGNKSKTVVPLQELYGNNTNSNLDVHLSHLNNSYHIDNNINQV